MSRSTLLFARREAVVDLRPSDLNDAELHAAPPSGCNCLCHDVVGDMQRGGCEDCDATHVAWDRAVADEIGRRAAGGKQ